MSWRVFGLIRVRTYIYRIHDDEGCLDIVFVGPRRDVYEQWMGLWMAQRERKRSFRISHPTTSLLLLGG
ncbi:protein of unknown function [Candidatus Nitrospira inopinata]|uniref:Uncharacterized protein n=1 Tax=Candidatus Nitrospira inopinata TaxID=1715989 RepID=A0A0S4KQR5_9BACT|nr:protein of unknown function [Candidatus Nitrospira inopinata]